MNQIMSLNGYFGLAAVLVFAISGVSAGAAEGVPSPHGSLPQSHSRNYRFDKKISREVLENYLSRAISMEGLLNGRGDLDDNIRMLKSIGAKFIGRSLCLWAGEANLLRNLERAKQEIPRVHAADPDMILQACIFEIVTSQVEQVPVPDWAFTALGQPVEHRNFRYADMLYPDGRRQNQWGQNASVPDVSRPETKLWFYFLAASYIDRGIEAIHFGQAEIMNGNDPHLDHWSQVLELVRAYAAKHARRHIVLCDAHVPSGGLVRDGRLLLDFHSFPLRIMEVPDKPQEAILKVGFSDGIYNRSKGGITFSGWKCDHLPYLVELDNWGASRQPGQAKAGGIWVWGYDEITWFAHQSKEYRKNWLQYARDWVAKTDPNGHLQMPGSRTMRSPLDRKGWYYANDPGPAVPDGLGDEDAIRAIWSADASEQPQTSQVKVSSGLLEGTSDAVTGIRAFRGIPYAQPPVEDLRWKPPQPVKRWEGVRKADRFGPRAMQLPVFGDMIFRSNGMSEDCLYLNVWTPAKSDGEHLPVLVYFYGGGFVAGDGSEPRYDGESMARKGIVTVTVNYRLGVFGFLAHPELTSESPHHASGDYGLLDQSAALQWVNRNISAFGGDPKKVTIGGESAGSFSVSMQMASPLSRHLIAGGIGESGAIFGETLAAEPLAGAEKTGAVFAKQIGAPSLAALRALSAEKLLEATRSNPFRFGITLDGYFLPKPAVDIYSSGQQAHVPLLAGWNAMEMPGATLLGREPVTPEGLANVVRNLYGADAEEALKVYHAASPSDTMEAATALASDRFIGYSTWKWTDLHGKTGGKPVYRYLYAHPRPHDIGAFHASEIEYALGNLSLSKQYAWTDDDRKVSATMQAYFANFILSGNPNGPGLPDWPAANRGDTVHLMRLDIESHAEAEQHRDRYLFLDAVHAGRRQP